jgi:hypothetical protein
MVVACLKVEIWNQIGWLQAALNREIIIAVCLIRKIEINIPNERAVIMKSMSKASKIYSLDGHSDKQNRTTITVALIMERKI